MNAQETPEQKRDRVLIEWQNAEQQLAFWKSREMELRKESFALTFPDPKVGTNRVPLGNGYQAKAVHSINYSIENDFLKCARVWDEIVATGNEGAFLAERLLKRKYELSTGEYKKLDLSNPTQATVKQLIDTILTTKDAAPTLEIVPPKEAP